MALGDLFSLLPLKRLLLLLHRRLLSQTAIQQLRSLFPCQGQRQKPRRKPRQKLQALQLQHLRVEACLLALRVAWCRRRVRMCHVTACLTVVFARNDFSIAGTCDDSSLQPPTWELSPVMYHLPHQDELGCESSLFHPKSSQKLGTWTF